MAPAPTLEGRGQREGLRPATALGLTVRAATNGSGHHVRQSRDFRERFPLPRKTAYVVRGSDKQAGYGGGSSGQSGESPHDLAPLIVR
jgi:hypothetical protein